MKSFYRRHEFQIILLSWILATVAFVGLPEGWKIPALIFSFIAIILQAFAGDLERVLISRNGKSIRR